MHISQLVIQYKKKVFTQRYSDFIKRIISSRTLLSETDVFACCLLTAVPGSEEYTYY